MQTTDLASIPAAAGTRTITMGRNRLSSIENWVKPSRPRAATAQPAGPDHADGQGRAPESTGLHRPVSQFVRATAPAAAR